MEFQKPPFCWIYLPKKPYNVHEYGTHPISTVWILIWSSGPLPLFSPASAVNWMQHFGSVLVWTPRKCLTLKKWNHNPHVKRGRKVNVNLRSSPKLIWTCILYDEGGPINIGSKHAENVPSVSATIIFFVGLMAFSNYYPWGPISNFNRYYWDCQDEIRNNACTTFYMFTRKVEFKFEMVD